MDVGVYSLRMSLQARLDILLHSVCPGRHFAEAALFAIVSSVLHTFDITGTRDRYSKPVPLEVKMTEGVLS